MNTRIVSMSDAHVSFDFFRDGGLQKTISLEMGINSLVSRFFKHEIPTEADIEYAITEIEDQLESRKEIVNEGDEMLICRDASMREAFGLDSNTEVILSIQDVEDEFTKYALLSMGQSPVLAQVTMNHEKYMTILIVREILNHLKFLEITLK